MKKIAPLFFILCVALSIGIFIWTARHSSAPVPTLAPKHPTISAQKGPLRLTLTLYSDTVSRNGPLWFRLSVTNVGKKPFAISDPLFSPRFLDDGYNLIDYLSGNHETKEGFYLVVLDEKGKEVDQRYQGAGLMMDVDPCLGGYDWDWSWSKIKAASDRFGKRQLEIDNFKALGRHSVDPGKSLETIAWSYHGYCNGERANPPTPPGRFAEFYKLDLSNPGSYHIYAALNHVPTHKEIDQEKKDERFAKKYCREGVEWECDWISMKKKQVITPDPDEVPMRTPAVSFEVLP